MMKFTASGMTLPLQADGDAALIDAAQALKAIDDEIAATPADVDFTGFNARYDAALDTLTGTPAASAAGLCAKAQALRQAMPQNCSGHGPWPFMRADQRLAWNLVGDLLKLFERGEVRP